MRTGRLFKIVASNDGEKYALLTKQELDQWSYSITVSLSIEPLNL